MATHREVLTLAGSLAERTAEILSAGRGVSATSLDEFVEAADALFRAWSDSLASALPAERLAPERPRSAESNGTRLVLETIATNGVLLRVGCTLLHAKGQQPSGGAAANAARTLMRKFREVMRAAARVASRDANGRSATRGAAFQLAQRCDRLSDVLCGAMMAHTNGSAFVVDARRARDFAQTFARFPALVRVPVRSAAAWWPADAGRFGPLSAELTRTLSQCFDGSRRATRRPTDPFTDLAEMFRRRSRPVSTEATRHAESRSKRLNRTARSAFPKISFAEIYRKVNRPN